MVSTWDSGGATSSALIHLETTWFLHGVSTSNSRGKNHVVSTWDSGGATSSSLIHLETTWFLHGVSTSNSRGKNHVVSMWDSGGATSSALIHLVWGGGHLFGASEVFCDLNKIKLIFFFYFQRCHLFTGEGEGYLQTVCGQSSKCSGVESSV